MSGYHVVRQGEYLSKIARQYGFENYDAIWDHEENAKLKLKRKNNPNILYPGDQLYIPDREPREESRATDKKHSFKLNVTPLWLRVVLKTCDDEPRQDLACLVNLDGAVDNQPTDGDGMIERKIPRKASKASFTYEDPDTGEEVELPILIGHLDPVDEVSGQIGRLNNLGYLAGDPQNPDDELFGCALEEFQCDHGLKADGICGPDTQAKLKEVHGC